MKKVLALILAILMVAGLFPMFAFATGADHTHSWSGSWTANDTHHWHACQSADCPITSESECSGYGAHDFSTYPYRCSICHYGSAHEHYGGTATCEYNATCEGCGTVYGDTNPSNHQFPNGFGEMIDGTSHKIMCSCGHVFVASEPHDFTPWDTNSDGTQERWCKDCLYAQTRSAQHTHSYSKATCCAPATCSCGDTTGAKDSTNHTGGTEIKNAVAATCDAEGYSGDTYCKGCGAKIASGEAIPKLVESVRVEMEENAGVDSVNFQPADGLILPEDATLIVKKQAMGIEPVISLLDPDADIMDTDFRITMLDDAVFTDSDGTKYRSGETVMIDGEKYCIGTYSGSGSILPVIGMDDGMMRQYDMASRMFEDSEGKQYSIMSIYGEFLRVDGILYTALTSYTDPDGTETKILCCEGKVAGQLTGDELRLYSDFLPENVTAEGPRYLGTVTPRVENEDIDLTVGKNYDVYLLGANDIQLQSGTGDPLLTSAESGKEKIGTVTQTFSVLSLDLRPELFSGSADTRYAAIHLSNADGNSGMASDIEAEFGEVTLSSDGKQLGVSFEVSHFSPFVVYAFTEAEETEIKVITSSVSNVGGADDSSVTINGQPGHNLTWLWITFAVAAGASVAAVFVTKKKKDRK